LGKLCPKLQQRFSGIRDADQFTDPIEREDPAPAIPPFAGADDDGDFDGRNACNPPFDMKPVCRGQRRSRCSCPAPLTTQFRG